MATRQTTLLLKRSNVIGKIPPLSGLTLGEMALNTADAKLYTLFTSGTTGATEVREIGWNRVSKTGDTISGDLIINGGLSATTISAATYQNLPVSGLIPGSNISITGSNGNFTVSFTGATSSTGVFGISNTSGVYTYYSTLSAAMSAATAGQTIEMFADVTETGNVTISLKGGVTIDGNGHTYTYTNNSGTMFSIATTGAVTINIVINNLNIVRSNTTSTGASIFSFVGSAGYATTKMFFNGCLIRYNVTSGNSPVITATDALNTLILNGLACITNGAGAAVTCNTANQCNIDCTGTSNGFENGTIRLSRISTTSGSGVRGGTAVDCNITCTSSGIGVQEGHATSTTISTNTGIGMQAGNNIAEGTAFNCVVSSTSAICFRRVIPTNCVGISGNNTVVDHSYNYGGTRFSKNYFVSNSSAPVFTCASNAMELLDSTIIQNGSGPGVRVTGPANQDIINCTIVVASSAANCINATATSNSRYIKNNFKGATTPVNANVVQQAINTQDNQGNILL